MFNGIYESQMQAAMMKAMTAMMLSLMKKMETLQSSATATAGTQPEGSFASALAKADTPVVTPARQTTSAISSISGGKYEDLIQKAAGKYSVDPNLIRAVIKAESNFNPRAQSYCGATGLMQLMPSTARGLGVTNAMDPEQNVDGGVRFLKGLLKRYNGSVELALAAYNAGPGAVDKYHGIPPYRETQTYVKRITDLMRSDSKRSA